MPRWERCKKANKFVEVIRTNPIATVFICSVQFNYFVIFDNSQCES